MCLIYEIKILRLKRENKYHVDFSTSLFLLSVKHSSSHNRLSSPFNNSLSFYTQKFFVHRELTDCLLAVLRFKTGIIYFKNFGMQITHLLRKGSDICLVDERGTKVKELKEKAT